MRFVGGRQSLHARRVSASAAPLELDSISNVYSGCFLKAVTKNYAGALVRLRRASDNVEADFYGTAGGWVSIAEVTAWLAGSTAYVVRIYDQFGYGRDIFQATTGLQPALDISGVRPCFVLNGTAYLQYAVSAGGSVADFANNVTAASIIAVRKFDSLASATSIFALATSGAVTRIHMFMSNTGPVIQSGGRRLDADSNVNSTGVAANTSWCVQVTRYDYAGAKLYNDVEAASEVKNPFQTAGSTSATSSTYATVGSNNGATITTGKMTGIALVSGLLTNTETANMIAAFNLLKAA